jgi:methyl-accepting chemotaxis protein
MTLKDMSIGKKLGAGFGVVIAVLLIVSFVSSNGMTTTVTIGVALLGLLGAVVLARVLPKAISGPVTGVADRGRQFAQGELEREIAIHRKDEVGMLADAFRAMQDRLQGIAAQTGVLVEVTKEGRLEVRAEAAGLEGDWRGMIEGLNGLVDAYAAPIKMTADYVARISRGDIPPKITDAYQGDFNTIKDNLNRCVDTVNLPVDVRCQLSCPVGVNYLGW